MHPVILLLLLVAGLIFVSWLKRAPPPARTQALVYAGIALLVVLVLTGRVHWLFAAAGALVPIAQRVLGAMRLWSTLKSARGPSPGQSSDIETEYLHMSLDHESGALGGRVLDGCFKGRQLDDMSESELLELLDECRDKDQQSVSVMEAYLDRRFGDSWREDNDRSAGGSTHDGTMTRQEACEILSVAVDAGEEEIIAAHRRLMQKLHPDRGGSTYLAAQINRAKDVLLST